MNVGMFGMTPDQIEKLRAAYLKLKQAGTIEERVSIGASEYKAQAALIDATRKAKDAKEKALREEVILEATALRQIKELRDRFSAEMIDTKQYRSGLEGARDLAPNSEKVAIEAGKRLRTLREAEEKADRQLAASQKKRAIDTAKASADFIDSQSDDIVEKTKAALSEIEVLLLRHRARLGNVSGPEFSATRGRLREIRDNPDPNLGDVARLKAAEAIGKLEMEQASRRNRTRVEAERMTLENIDRIKRSYALGWMKMDDAQQSLRDIAEQSPANSTARIKAEETVAKIIADNRLEIERDLLRKIQILREHYTQGVIDSEQYASALKFTSLQGADSEKVQREAYKALHRLDVELATKAAAEKLKIERDLLDEISNLQKQYSIKKIDSATFRSGVQSAIDRSVDADTGAINAKVALAGETVLYKQQKAEMIKIERDFLDEITNIKRRNRLGELDREQAEISITAIRDANEQEKKIVLAASEALVAIKKKADADELESEREKLKQIALLRMQYKGKVISGDEYSSSLSSIRFSNPTDSKVGATAALHLENYRKEVEKTSPVQRGFRDIVEGNTMAMENHGKNIQWTGRQLEYNFTIPIMRAGRAIYEYQKLNQQALTSLVKVYGDGSDASGELSTQTLLLGQSLQEVNRGSMSDIEQTAYDLGRAFRALSDGFGVSIDKVSEIGHLWAATGQQGVGLAKSVKNTLEAMMVGDFKSSEEAFKALIKVQNAYGLSADQVRQALALINISENITAASFTDLVEAIGRGGATMKTAGISLREFTGLLSLLIPSNTAETAGNGMKTLVSRIMAPTDDAIEAIRELGITVDETFYSMTGTERLLALAKAFDSADASTRQLAEAAVAGRYQINRFDLLMQGLLDTSSSYYKVLDATSDGLGENSRSMETYRKELKLFLDSMPQRVEIAKTMIMNLGSQILMQVLPAILYSLAAVREFVDSFSRMDKAKQQMIILAILATAAAGPFLRLYGAFNVLIAQIGKALKFVLWLRTGYIKLAAAQAGSAAAAWASVLPYIALVAAIAAVIAIIYIFRDEIYAALLPIIKWGSDNFNKFVEAILRAFNALPTGIQNALIAVVRTIGIAVKKAWELLQWLNPFKRHSPSLVDNVTAGVAIIAAQYASLANIGRVYMSAANGLRNFTAATADLRQKVLMNERSDVQKNIGENMPEVLPAVNVMFAQMDKLKEAMDAVTVEVDKQQQVVNALDAEYRRLGLRLKEAESAFKLVERAANAIKDQLDAAKDRLSNWASTPIEGSKALSDALFENEMAQKRLRLEIMRMEDAGQSVEDVANKLALLQGEIETLQALQSELRSAGAGSEITGQLDAQIKALRDQAAALQGGANNSGIALLEEQLKRLQREAERMDLEGAIRFDPLKRQIEDLANTTKEATFEEIIAGMRQARAEVDVLTVQYEEAMKAVDAQKPGLDILRTAHSDLGDTLGIEQEKLSLLKDSYSELEDLYSRIDEAIKALVSDIKTLNDAAGGAASGFPGGDFDPGAGVNDFIQSEGDLKKFADDLLKEFESSFGDFDLLGPFRKKWQEFKAGVSAFLTTENIVKLIINAIFPVAGIAIWFVDLEKAWDGIKNAWSLVWGTLKDRFSTFMGAIRTIGDTIWGVIKRIGDVFGSIGSTIGSVVGAVIGFFANFGDNMGSIFGNIGDILSRAGSFIETLFTERIPYAIGWLIGAFVALPFNLLDALGDLGVFLWNGLRRGFDWLLDRIGDILRAIAMGFTTLPGRAIEALNDFGGLIWRGIAGGFNWLVDQVGSIIDSIVDFFRKLPGRISDLAGGVADAARGIGSSIWDAIRDGFGGAWDIAGDLITNMGSVLTRVYNGLIDRLETALNSAIDGFNDAAPGWLPNVPYIRLAFLRATGPMVLHDGGIVPGMPGTEVPAILQAGEGVLSMRMMDLIERATKTTPAPEQGVVNNNNSKTVNFYGDLSFPNITDPNDAERFIRNLEALAVA